MDGNDRSFQVVGNNVDKVLKLLVCLSKFCLCLLLFCDIYDVTQYSTPSLVLYASVPSCNPNGLSSCLDEVNGMVYI